MRWVAIILILSCCFGQSKYPADSLLVSKDISIFHKIGILPLAGWQRISYNADFLNCQFHPSCSNYGATAISQFGSVRGSIMASERIIRCNPFAIHYHIKYNKPFHSKDGRLEDPISPNYNSTSNKSPLVAGLLSSIIPGSGRMYAGRFYDGLMGLWTMTIVGQVAYASIKNERPIAGPIYTTMAVFVYLGEIYGGVRAAKLFELQKQTSFNSIN